MFVVLLEGAADMVREGEAEKGAGSLFEAAGIGRAKELLEADAPAN